MTNQDWYTGFTKRTYEEFMERVIEDWKRHLASVMEGMSLESLFGSSDIGGILGQLGKPGSSRMSGDDTAYRVLGLEKTASDEEIKKRYRDLAKRLHPDVAGKETEHLFKLIQAAYELIARQRGWKP